MKKFTDMNEGRAAKVQKIQDLDAGSIEFIKDADRKEDDASGDQREVYRIMNCNGVTIGVHIHKSKS